MNPKGLWRDPRSGIFYLRRRIPLPLQSAFACGQLYKVSLATADPRDAERKLAIANGEFEQKCDQFRATLANGVAGSFTSDEARVLVERLLTARSATGFASGGMDVAFVLKDLDDAVADQAGDHRSTAQDMSPAEWIAYRKKLAGSDLDDEFSPETLARIEAHHASVHRDPGALWFSFQKRVPRRRWRPLLSFAVTKIKRELKLPDETNRGIDEPLADALADALCSVQVREQVPLPPSARRRENASRLQPDMKLDALEARWIAARKPTLKAQAATNTAVRYFKSYIGDVGIGEITPNDLFEFRDAVAALPKSMPRVHRMMEFVDIHALYADKSGTDRISPQSIKKYLGAIQALLGYAFQERFIPANTGAGIKVEGYTKKSNRRPFTQDELAQLFAADLFVAPWSKPANKSKVSDSTLRWLFLLGLCTGARIEELGQILLADIKSELGIPYIDVTDYVMDDIEERKRVKTDGSIRVIPLHPKLIGLGFLDYVQRMRSSGAVRLFPDLVADSLGVKTKEASRRANRLIDNAVGDDPRLVFYSFRHSFKDLCRDANIPKDVHDQLMGHSPADVGGGYGLGRAINNLAAHLKRIRFSFVDWDAIKVTAEHPEALPDAHAGTRSSARMSVLPGRRAVR